MALSWLESLSRITTSPGLERGREQGLDEVSQIWVWRPVDQPGRDEALAARPDYLKEFIGGVEDIGLRSGGSPVRTCDPKVFDFGAARAKR